MLSPKQQILEAIASLRIIGGLFLLLAGTIGYYLRKYDAPPIAFTPTVVVMVLPAVGYIAASIMLPRHAVEAPTWAMRLSLIQPAVALLCLAANLFISRTDSPEVLTPIILPGGFTLFFIPAILVQGRQIRRALKALRELPDVQRGFDLLPVAKIAPPEERGDHV